eukprot:CAMPEP_0196579800 /NCGR_PEP_ID=MMETSP1081-20130531/24824_1 /TAXON_ID=36882 /ORGANISM="Pyramimonas amylifera, Strain CCMP720" /LENGTH=302 /DNA_ID=CAMNT_0041899493 /DNA_START=80 /DNA_END=988 /DNA_ORIENTATION=+
MASVCGFKASQVIRSSGVASERVDRVGRAARISSTKASTTLQSKPTSIAMFSNALSNLRKTSATLYNVNSTRVQRTKLFAAAEEPDLEAASEGEVSASSDEGEEESPEASGDEEEDGEESGEVGEMMSLMVAKEAAMAELQAAKDAQLRLQADFDNFRKRTAREKEQLSSRAKAEVMESLLLVVDNFELAKTNINPDTEAEQKIQDSYHQLYSQMVDVLKSLGLTMVPTVGQPFNPEVHDAIMREPTADAEDGTVIQEFRRGFMFNGAMLRPAMVKVAVAPEGSLEEESSEDSEVASEEATS